jgi:hypothetical protein
MFLHSSSILGAYRLPVSISTREEAWGKVPVGAARAVLMRASVVKRGAMNFMITAYWIKNRTLIELEV